MMNSGTKAAILISKANYFQLQSALFHSTPFLQRKRRSNFWDPSSQRANSSNFNYRRSRKLHEKQPLLRNANAYVDYIFQSWNNDSDEEDPSSSGSTSWFRKQYSKGSKRNRTGNQGFRHWGRKNFQFCEDVDFEVETIFQSAFGGNRYFYWSFTDEEYPQQRCSSGYSAFGGNQYFYWSFTNEEKHQWSNSSGYSNDYGRNWRHRVEEDYDSSSESDSSESDLASDRLVLGLSASGPLRLEDVKKAYRACALKWHPDRHQGSLKVVAEEQFKLCSAAYQSLCDKLAVA